MNKVYVVNHINNIFEYKLAAETNTRYVLESSHGTSISLLKNKVCLTKKEALLKVKDNLKKEFDVIELQLNNLKTKLEEVLEGLKNES